MEDKQRFCPICRGFHDPDFGCADRAGSVLRAAGVERKPMDTKELQKTEKEADRTMLYILFAVIAVVALFFYFFT